MSLFTWSDAARQMKHRMNLNPAYPSRRSFLQRTGCGFGITALSALLADQRLLAAPSSSSPLNPLSPKTPHFAARAKSVIWLFMNGGQSQVDTWDYKPGLVKADGQKLEGFDKNTGFFSNDVGPLMKSPFKFARHGRSGTWVSEIFPYTAQHVDDMAFVHSCFTATNNHSPALFEANTGMSRMGFPCVGSWVTYGLGTLNQNLPAFVVMYDTLGRGLPKGHASNWGSGFLPGVYQGTALNHHGQPINNMDRSAAMTSGQQRAQLDLLRKLNQHHLAQNPAETELAARIESFELAYRMQTAAPEALSVDSEPESIKELYGLNDKRCAHFSRQCLTARRLVQRGVRFVQTYSGGMENERSWDGHKDIKGNHSQFAGETDEIGHKAAVNKVSINDLHATILHLLGMNHEQLTYFYNGRNFRLTDVAGEVVNGIIA